MVGTCVHHMHIWSTYPVKHWMLRAWWWSLQRKTGSGEEWQWATEMSSYTSKKQKFSSVQSQVLCFGCNHAGFFSWTPAFMVAFLRGIFYPWNNNNSISVFNKKVQLFLHVFWVKNCDLLLKALHGVCFSENQMHRSATLMKHTSQTLEVISWMRNDGHSVRHKLYVSHAYAC